MNRRVLIKNLVLVSGGVILLPSCLNKEEKRESRSSFKNLSFTKDQETLLGEVAETIIPETDTPGAKALGLHSFVLTMLADCYEKPEQERFIIGLNLLDNIARSDFETGFVKCTPEQKMELLRTMEAGEAAPEVLSFYNITKNEVIKGFLNSKLVMTELRKYELVPARYNGYFPVKSA